VATQTKFAQSWAIKYGLQCLIVFVAKMFMYGFMSSVQAKGTLQLAISLLKDSYLIQNRFNYIHILTILDDKLRKKQRLKLLC